MHNPSGRLLAYAVMLSVGLAADQASKASAFAPGAETGGPREIAAGLFTGALTRNFGAAGNLASGFTPAPTIFALGNLAVVGLMTWWAVRRRGKLAVPLVVFGGLAAAGIVGNAIDRLALGYVRDFLVFAPWPIWVFNLADVFILLGLVLLLATWAASRHAGSIRRGLGRLPVGRRDLLKG